MAKNTIKKNGILGKIDIPTVVKNNDNHNIEEERIVSTETEDLMFDAVAEVEDNKKPETSEIKKMLDAGTQPQVQAEPNAVQTIEHSIEKKEAPATTEPLYLTAKRVNKSIFDLSDDEIEAIRLAKAEKKTVRRGIILTERNDKWVSLTAQKFGSSMNNIINELIKAEIEREESRKAAQD